MIVDTSAIMAIIRDEVDAARYVTALSISTSTRISAGTWIELGTVLTRTADDAATAIGDRLFDIFAITIEAVTPLQAQIAREAYREFGRGTTHEANLNFGDCFAYSLAKHTGEPLLYKGNDFSKTDIVPAL